MIINNTKKKHLEEKETPKKTINKPLILLVGSILLIIIIIIYVVIKSYYNNYNYLKEDKKEYLVYTRYNQNNVEVPYINVDSSNVQTINNDIDNYCNKYSSIDNIQISYEYDISGKYLSVIIKILNEEDEYGPVVKFKTYNISLKTRKEVKDEELLKMFNVTDNKVSNKIKEQLVNYYKEEVKEGYIEKEECNYDCFLSYRNVSNYLDDIEYAIKGGKLVVFKPFKFKSIYGEEEYYNDSHFEFVITE